MGLVHTQIELKNPKDPTRTFTASALVDTGAMHLCLPPHVVLQLGLSELQKREVITADGTQRLCSYVGPVEVRFGERGCYTGALVLGTEVLLGAVPMEDMDLIVSPSKRTVIANPESPNIPSSVIK